MSLGLFVLFCKKLHLNFDRNCTEYVDNFRSHEYFYNITSSNSRACDIFATIFIFFSYFHLCLVVFSEQVFLFFFFLVKFIFKYSIVFDAIVIANFSLI